MSALEQLFAGKSTAISASALAGMLGYSNDRPVMALVARHAAELELHGPTIRVFAGGRSEHFFQLGHVFVLASHSRGCWASDVRAEIIRHLLATPAVERVRLTAKGAR